RKFKPNLRPIKLDIDAKVIKSTVCMKCYKRLRKEESEIETHAHVKESTDSKK
ncbi:hypothetical protein KC622_02565, partial [Candidatus Dojkabacteria bacterium]|nr:hypothetical protein [Candidatus Dojkabacteria bacterium]